MKKVNILKVKMLFVLLLFGVSIQASDTVEKSDYDKTIHEKFSVNSDAILDLENEFTSVEIIVWDKNEIEISVDITVEASSQEKADNWFDKIRVDISGDKNRVSFASGLKNGSNCNNIEWNISAVIHAPRSIRLEAEVEFGNLEVDEITGVCDIEVQFGNFEAKILSNSGNRIEVSYGNIEMNMLAAKDISVEFGAIEIGTLISSCDIDSGFSQVEIGEIDSNCKKITVSVEFGGFDITLPSNGDYIIEATASFGSIDFDNEIKTIEKECGMFDDAYTGTLGNGSGVIDISSSYSDVNVKVD